jgi:histidinol-phosphate aminotransferase
MTDPFLHIHQNERAVHGAIDYGEMALLNLHPSEILDFSVNSNPYGPSPAVHTAIAQVPIERYPDRECWQLRQAIRQYELEPELRHELKVVGVPWYGGIIGAVISPAPIIPPYHGTPDLDLPLTSLVCGNGTSELIWALARAFLAPGKKALLVAPTFGEYRAASLAAGAALIELPTQEEQQFQPDLIAVRSRIIQEKPSVVWLCNPNNPTGLWIEYEQLSRLLDACHSVGALLVIDEAYWRFVTPPATWTALHLMQQHPASPLFALRSLTKDFALAGLRLGYAFASPTLISRVQVQLPSWNVNALAQAAGIAALHDRAHLHTTLSALVNERQAFFAALEEAGLHVLPSRTHFCLIEVGDAQSVRQKLLMQRLLVRDCTSFGLPHHIRVATRPAHEWRQLVKALREVVRA